MEDAGAEVGAEPHGSCILRAFITCPRNQRREATAIVLVKVKCCCGQYTCASLIAGKEGARTRVSSPGSWVTSDCFSVSTRRRIKNLSGVGLLIDRLSASFTLWTFRLPRITEWLTKGPFSEHSGGTMPESHRLPCYALAGTPES